MADAPVVALLGRTDDLAKGWLLALLEEAPLDRAEAIVTSELSRDGPRLCEALVRALADDEDLGRLKRGGALELLASRVGELAGAEGVVATARAVDVLQAVLWSALRSELSGADGDQVSELAERLALVAQLVRAAALDRTAGIAPPIAPPRERPRVVEQPMPEAQRWPDEEDREYAARRMQQAAPAPGSELWRAALEEHIEEALRSGSPLALLFAMLEDAERVEAVEEGGEHKVFNRFAGALRLALRREDILARETGGRAWVIARDTGREGAQALGSRMVQAVESAEPWRGAPMAVSVGLAVLGEDGTDAMTLIDVAEREAFAASATGIGFAAPLGTEKPSPRRGGSRQGSGPRLVS